MIPTRQTQFVATHPKGHGNCQAACIASILEMPLEDVIDTAGDECHEHKHGWWYAIEEWLARRGLAFAHYYVGDEDDIFDRIDLTGKYTIGAGPSPRGAFHHAVVCKNGRMVFDPHPSDDGCLTINRHSLIVPLNEKQQAYWSAQFELEAIRINEPSEEVTKTI